MKKYPVLEKAMIIFFPSSMGVKPEQGTPLLITPTLHVESQTEESNKNVIDKQSNETKFETIKDYLSFDNLNKDWVFQTSPCGYYVNPKPKVCGKLNQILWIKNNINKYGNIPFNMAHIYVRKTNITPRQWAETLELIGRDTAEEKEFVINNYKFLRIKSEESYFSDLFYIISDGQTLVSIQITEKTQTSFVDKNNIQITTDIDNSTYTKQLDSIIKSIKILQ